MPGHFLHRLADHIQGDIPKNDGVHNSDFGKGDQKESTTTGLILFVVINPELVVLFLDLQILPFLPLLIFLLFPGFFSIDQVFRALVSHTTNVRIELDSRGSTVPIIQQDAIQIVAPNSRHLYHPPQ
jgi:hypothetical protein